MDFPKSVPSVGLVDGKFVDEDPVAGTPGSLIPAQWGNAVTEEVLNVVLQAGLTPEEDDNTQLKTAIGLIIDSSNQATTATQAEAQAGTNNTKRMTPLRVFQAIAAVVAQATEAAFGWAKIATQAQTNAGTDDATVVTPKKLKNGFLFSISTNGYIIFPSWAGGFGVQWGVVASLASGVPLTQALPVSFANNCLWCLAAGSDPGNNNALACNASPISAASLRLAQSYGSAMSARYFAIGN